MTKLEDIEKAVAELAPRELDRFRAWFEAFQAARFDEKIKRDAASCKLDRLAETAVEDFRKGRARTEQRGHDCADVCAGMSAGRY